MKYLVINRRNAMPIPPEQAATLFQAAKFWLKTRQAEGGIDCYYIFADTKGGLTISNADSHEEVYDHILDFPLYMFFD